MATPLNKLKKCSIINLTSLLIFVFSILNGYSQIKYPRLLSNGVDTLTVNKRFIYAQFDTSVTYSDLRISLNSIAQLDGFDSTNSQGDTSLNMYLLDIDSGLTNIQYKQLIIYIKNNINGAYSVNEVYEDNAGILGNDYFVVKLKVTLKQQELMRGRER